jgi:hypothetical protein|tara:strand:- start:125 stop:331 length:207 start_codon:yes stop_codon:yes gene_type:complete
MEESEVKRIAQSQAEEAYVGFLVWGKRVTYASIGVLLMVATCNFGVEDGPRKTGSGYNGDQYAPTNMN